MKRRNIYILVLSFITGIYLVIPAGTGKIAGFSSQKENETQTVSFLDSAVLSEAFSTDAIYADEENIALTPRPEIASERNVPAAILPSDSLISRQWYIYNNGTFGLSPSKKNADIQLPEAWQVTTGDTNIIIAVLDGGIDFSNPEFEGRIWYNKNEIAGNNIDDDSNGFVDDVNGWDFVDNDNIADDEAGHGTNVTGIIGANANKGSGYAGIDWKAKLMILKIADKNGVGRYSNWASAIYYAVNHGAKVINMSVGGTTPSAVLQKAVDYAYENGVVVVASMMNANTGIPYYPAACDHVIAVGATNPDDTRAAPFFWDSKSGSNYGDHISIVAPGNFIYGLSLKGENIYWGGTSQAAPVVSGIVSLLLAQDASRSPDNIKNILISTADDMVGTLEEDVEGWDKYYGFGRVNAYRALQYIYNYEVVQATE